jgi:hypothetical protein
MFTLVNLESATLLSERFTLEDGRRAARAARLLSRKTGKRFQPRKIESVAIDTSWHDREIERFNTGEYLPLCEELTRATQIYETAHNLNLFAHVAKKNPALIAYTKDAIKGAQDKQSLLSIEAFVKMVCVNNNADIQALLIDLQTRYAKETTPQPFKLATTPDDIERVYTNYAPDSRAVSVSCMRYGHDETNWPKVDSKPFHPVRVYGAGDLAVAYMTNGAGETTARTLVWPEHKIYSRMYADNDALHNALKEAGYSKSSYYGTSKSLNGARLLLIKSDHGDYIAPYLDEIGNALLGDNNLIIDEEGDYICQSTNGTAEQKQEGECCEHCGDYYEADDMTTVYTDSRQRGGETWCRHCRDSDAFYCEGTEEYYSDNVDYGVINDETYTQRYIDNNAHYCEYYEESTFDDVTTVIVDSDGETQDWSDAAVSNHAYKYNGDYYSNDLESVRVVTERYVLQRNNVSWDRYRYISTNFWYADKVAEIPEYLIDEESVDVIYNEAKESYYLKNYVDHYPVARERFDVVDAIVEEMIADVLAA